MPWRNIGIVYRKEMVEALRDRRTLISTILVPILLFPVLTVAVGYVAVSLIGEASRESSKIMLLGGNDSPAIVESLKKVKNLIVVPNSANYVDLISNKKIRAAVEIPPGLQSAAGGEYPPVKIYIFSGDLKSTFAATRIEKFFSDYRDALARERLTRERLPVSLLKAFDIKQQNVVSAEKVAGETFGGIIPYLVIIMCLTGAMYPAMDLTAGEKERATMETILSSPVSRTHLVLGKFLLVLTASLITAALSVTSMGSGPISGARYTDHHWPWRRSFCFHGGVTSGGDVFRCVDYHCSFCQKFQRSAELYLTADGCGHRSGGRRHASRSGTYPAALADTNFERKPSLQRPHHGNLSLELDCPHFPLNLCLRRRCNFHRREDVPTGICALPFLISVVSFFFRKYCK
jgi:hypothetical protein